MAFALPPLSTLRSFEAVGRLGSFKAAAEELHVTPSAVSHAIITLERWLGTALFLRRPHGVAPTAAAEAYRPFVESALRDLAAATAGIPGRKPRGRLSLSVAPTFAGAWLLPRLSRFTQAHPDLSIAIDTTRHCRNLALDRVDLVLRLAVRPRGPGRWLRLLQERLVPVTSPGLWEEIAHLGLVEALERVPLIHVTTVGRDWRPFADLLPSGPGRRRGDLRFDTVHLAIQAARQGLGIAVGRRPLVDGDLEAGALVALPLAERPIDDSYWLVGLPATLDRPEAKAFRRWLLEEVATLEAGESRSRSGTPLGEGTASVFDRVTLSRTACALRAERRSC